MGLKIEPLMEFERVLEKYWAELPIEVCHAWENYENKTGTYESSD